MGEKYEPQKGDRVRVVLEGAVDSPPGAVGPDDQDLFIGAGGDGDVHIVDVRNVVSIEKLGPPVEVFGDGDIVRRKDDHTGGVFYLFDGKYVAVPVHVGFCNWKAHARYEDEFTSEEYERVTLVEAPF